MAGFPRIIEVKHRSHGVHAQTVDVIFVEPEERVADKKIAHFVAAKIENERAPILLLALARVHVLVKIGAVEFGERVGVLWKMRGHPIHDHADAGLMTFVDEMAEVVRRTEPAGGRVIICDLITPRTFERMLGDRQQLDVGVTHLQHVRQQCLGKFEITELAISLFSFATPRAEVHFVNADRTLRPVLLPARFHPRAIVPSVTFQIVNHRRRRFAVLIEKARTDRS